MNGGSESITLPGLLARQAAARPDHPALHFEDRTWTWSELAGRIWRLARTLRELGVENGDLVSVMCRRRPEAVEAFLAICAAGGRVVPVNHHLPPVDLANLLATHPPRAMILDDALRPVLDRIPGDRPEGLRILATRGPGDVNYEEAVGGAAAEPQDRLGPDEPAYLNFTSGSTGAPKAALTTQAQVIWNTRAAVEALGLTTEDVHLPLFAVFSHPHELFARALYTGATIAMVESIHPRGIATAIQDRRVTCVIGVATIYRLLLPFARSGRFDLSSLRIPESGGMVTDPRLNQDFQEAVGVPIVPVWGSTETTGIALANPPGEPFPLDAIGRVCPHYEVKVVDESGRRLPAGATGELVVRGPALMTGYAGDPAATARAVRDGWYHTGDLVTSDADGFFTFRGRRTSMIKVGGLKVFSEEVEEALCQHPRVREAVVVPAGDDLRGEIHRALIVLEPGDEVTPLELKRFLQARIARYKVPKELRFVSEIPRTAAGKVVRRTGGRRDPGEQVEDPDVAVRRLRKEITELDLRLLRLLCQRARLVQRKCEILGRSPAARFDPGVLEERLRTLLGYNTGPLPDALVEAIFRHIESQFGMLG